LQEKINGKKESETKKFKKKKERTKEDRARRKGKNERGMEVEERKEWRKSGI
jgi:hypothetical protein